MSRTRFAVIVLTLMALTTAAGGSDADEVAARVSQKVMSPFCPGVTLHDCPSGEADRLRLRIEGWAKAGMTEGQIVDRLRAQYGSMIDASPPVEGAGILAWLMPAIAVLAGVGVAMVTARRFAARRRADGSEPPVPSPADRARVEAELHRYRGESM